MSFLMVLPVNNVDGETFERIASENAEAMRGISGRGKEAGAIHHAFYEADGKVFVVDEWDSPESFQAFFETEAPNIGPLMEQAGAQPGEPTFYRKLSTDDQF